MPNKDFDDADDEHLVQVVSGCRLIFDPEDKDFRNVCVKNAAWGGVAAALGKEVEQCKKRWRDIRDNYNKIIRKLKYTGPPGSQKWPLFDKLQFLSTVGRDKYQYQPPEEPVTPESDEEARIPVEACLDIKPDLSECEAFGASDRKRRKVRTRKKHLDPDLKPEDDVDLFMKSIALSVKKLPPQQIWEAKTEILNTVSRLSQSVPVSSPNSSQ